MLNMFLRFLFSVFVAVFTVGSCQDSNYDTVCTPKKDVSANQLCDYKNSVQGTRAELTTAAGANVGDSQNVLTVGPRGPVILQDFIFLEELSKFNRERVPERVVHAKGAGAFGYFEATDDISRYTKAQVFQVGKKTPLVTRLSTVGGELGSADTVRDLRGFALKLYTDEGNLDLLGLNAPVFFVRDPLRLPKFIHSQKRNPVTNLHDADAIWDFFSLNPETMHVLVRLFSDRGTPDGYRYMSGHAGNTFKLVNEKGEAVYNKFHWKTNQGMRNLTAKRAMELTASDPDYSTRDLYDAIATGQFPSWTFYIQVMTFKEAEDVSFNPFDVTKVWPEEQFPMIQVGQVVLNQNPSNYFAQVEQLGFAPSNLIPGIEPSPDKVLQGRLFVYSDTQRYRIGTNFQQLPVNFPKNSAVENYQRDGPQTVTDNQGGAPNFYPNSFNGPVDDPQYNEAPYFESGDVARYNSSDDDNYSQAGEFYKKELIPAERRRLVQNVCESLVNADDSIQERMAKNFDKVDPELGRSIRKRLQKIKMEREKKG